MLKIINGYGTSGATDLQLAHLYEILSPHTPLLTTKEYKHINTKILSVIANKKERIGSVADDVRRYVADAEGEFSLNQMFGTLCITAKEDKDSARHTIKRLTKDNVIQVIGVKTGNYRKVDDSEDVIDWKNADEHSYPLWLPMGLHDLVKIYPGNIIVVAGASNTGKTAFMLAIIQMNQHQHETTYFNSEMGPSELKTRLSKFNEICPLDKWEFTAIERSKETSSWAMTRA